MRIVIQRVLQASVEVDCFIKSSIKNGLLVLAAWETEETDSDINWIASKIINLRIFCDNNGLMNLSVKDIDGDILVVSQFTLHASTR
jgi:D-tyrosyl-tRNA(Tyr) deacylase